MRPSPAKLTLAVTVIFALACGKSGASDVEANCGDGLDEDGDGFMDCDDAECQADPVCDDEEVDEDPEDCNNGDDDDGDDDIDCEDIDCADDSACASADELCANGVDDDDDGDVDCDDSDCFDKPACDDVPQDEDCNNGFDDDGDGDTDCDDPDCSSDPDCDVVYFEPAYFNVTGGFAYNSSTRKVVTAYDDAGSPIPPFVQVVFMEEAYLTTGDEQYLCSVLWAYDSTTALPLAIMTDADGVTHGGFKLTLSSDSAWSSSTDCSLDPAVFGSDPIDWVRTNLVAIGVGVGKASADVQSTIDDQVDPADAVYFGGAGMWMDAAYYAPNYAFGYETDSSMTLTYDGAGSNVPLLASQYALSTGVPAHGYYQTSLLFVFAL